MSEKLLCMTAPAKIVAQKGDEAGPPKFDVTAYTGGAMALQGWDLPVVIDLAGMSFANSLVANLDHDPSKRVGHVTAKVITEKTLTLSGIASAATESRREVVESAKDGFVWQASVEASPDVITEVGEGEPVTVNGQEFTGPLYVGTKTTLTGFGFVSHGADDQTEVSIAATAKTSEADNVDTKLKAWLEDIGVDVENITDEKLETLKANYAGTTLKKKSAKGIGPGIEAVKLENERKDNITSYALRACEGRAPFEIEPLKLLAEQAMDEGWSYDKFRLEIHESGIKSTTGIRNQGRNRNLTNRVMEAALCVAGRLQDVEEKFPDQELQSAHDHFPSGVTLNQFILKGAEMNGHNSNHSSRVDITAQRAAFGMTAPNSQIQAQAWSTMSTPDVLAATANKFLHEGWMAVDLTPLAISSIRNVSDFKTHTTVSLHGDLQYEKVGSGGEIPHGELKDLTYTNKADTYAKMLAITRNDIINDDLGALTAVPRRLGRGGALKLNDVFWTVFLDNTGSFFTVGNSNVSTDTGALGLLGLEEAEVIFMNQTDPDSKPLAVQPKILLVPTAIKTTALQLMNSELHITGSTTTTTNANIWNGRFRVESSPYMSNSSYTGYSASVWYMLADPNEMPVVEIAALNGRIEPFVESADADFNVLGVQMRGYSDIGVALQEYRGGVRADGSAAG